MTCAELTDKAKQMQPASEWERELYMFVNEWTGPGNFIEVKTSGSTGLPKLIRHSKEAMRRSAAMTCDFLGLKRGMNALLCLSTRNIAGMMMVVRAFERGLEVIPAFSGSHPLKDIDTTIQIDFCAMVPAQVYNSLQVPEERRILERIGNLIIGGAPASYRLQQEISELPGNVFLTFGMTETMSHIAMRKLNGLNASDEYKTLPGIKIESGDKSNLIVYVPYLGQEPVITNDLVEITGDDSFKWLGRSDHVINSGGFKIFAENVEMRIAHIMERMLNGPGTTGSGFTPVTNSGAESTQRYFIASLPDEKLGEIPVLILEGAEPDADASEEIRNVLFTRLESILPKHEIPRQVFYFPKFVETPTGKIIRSATLKKMGI